MQLRTTIIVSAIMILLRGLLSSLQAQGKIYVSNLGSPTAGNLPVASDAWLSTWFQTGPSPAGYSLNSIHLSMGTATGNASGFSVMLWDFQQQQSIANLTGSAPATNGLYTYSAANFFLQPSSVYWFAIKGGTPAATGSFHWNYSPLVGFIPGVDGWDGGGAYQTSIDGQQWSRLGNVGTLQFAVNATAIPEPSGLALFGLGGLLLLTRRCIFTNFNNKTDSCFYSIRKADGISALFFQ